ncbi:hypothetical protein [Sphingomonas turrisvirgatae]|uniref:hypothetical protein n=1 Tax=Sphingomonas turrisvirgatae TaxID=1888892 RepID=UPI001041ECD3|nr:hypothetical protein [Sphingomonas turrisvirgatae]
MSKLNRLQIRDNLYILVFNTMDRSYDADDVQSYIENNERVVDWWNYFPGTYLIEFSDGPKTFMSELYGQIPDASCFCSRINTGEFTGRINGDAWLWLLDLPEERKAQLREQMIEDTRRLKDRSS